MDVYKIIVTKLEDNTKLSFAVPADMPLWSLHYLLGKYFDLDISTPYSFALQGNDFYSLCGKTAKQWKTCVGVWFMSPYRSYNEDDWCEEFDGNGEYQEWLDKKIKGPYVYDGHFDSEEAWKDDLDEFVYEYADNVIVSKTKNDYGYYSVRPISQYDEYDEDEYDIYLFDELPIEYIPYLFDHNIDDLIETLTIADMNHKYFIYRDAYNRDAFIIEICYKDSLTQGQIDSVNATYMPQMAD